MGLGQPAQRSPDSAFSLSVYRARNNCLQGWPLHTQAISIARMPQRAKLAYEAWKEADRRARAAEDLLHQAWDAHDAGGPPPQAVLIEEVSRLRAEANEKLREVTRRLRP